jgi:hypothetical protein
MRVRGERWPGTTILSFPEARLIGRRPFNSLALTVASLNVVEIDRAFEVTLKG